MVWIEGSEDHTQELIRRFDRAPKPMYYQPAFLEMKWNEYQELNKLTEAQIDPDDFVRWTYAQALAHRQPRYAAMAEKWGVTLAADKVAKIRSAGDMDALITQALEAKQKTA